MQISSITYMKRKIEVKKIGGFIMKQSMSKKIAAMGIAGLTGLAVIGSSLGGATIVASAKTSDDVMVTERQDRVKPATGSAIDKRPEGENKVKPATGSAIDKKPEKEDNTEKPAASPAAGASDKNTNNDVKKVTKKVKVKKAKKTSKNKITITLDGTNVWSNVKLQVKTSAGKTVKAKIVKKTKNSCVIQTNKKLQKKTYVIKVKGVKTKGASKYETITTKVKVK